MMRESNEREGGREGGSGLLCSLDSPNSPLLFRPNNYSDDYQSSDPTAQNPLMRVREREREGGRERGRD